MNIDSEWALKCLSGFYKQTRYKLKCTIENAYDPLGLLSLVVKDYPDVGYYWNDREGYWWNTHDNKHYYEYLPPKVLMFCNLSDKQQEYICDLNDRGASFYFIGKFIQSGELWKIT